MMVRGTQRFEVRAAGEVEQQFAKVVFIVGERQPFNRVLWFSDDGRLLRVRRPPIEQCRSLFGIVRRAFGPNAEVIEGWRYGVGGEW